MKKLLFIIFLSYIKLGNAQIITTIAGKGTEGYSGDGGQAIAAELRSPTGVAFDAFGNMYIADNLNHCIRRVSKLGIIQTVAGNGTRGFRGDGGPAIAAQLDYPYAVVIDKAGNLYIPDLFNHRIRKIDTDGIISTIAGSGATGAGSKGGFSGDGGQADKAQLAYPNGIAIDTAGNLYIVDSGNNRIRKINTFGIISTVAGCNAQGYSGDSGLAKKAALNCPLGVTVDKAGNIFIADLYNHRIRKVNTLGVITTYAGTGNPGFKGDSGQAITAEISNPIGLAVDAAGNLIIADFGNNRIRKVDTAGKINTIVGTGKQGYSGDGGLARDAELFDPYGVAFDALGNLYISDLYNQRIRKVAYAKNSIQKLVLNNMQIKVYPNPTNGLFNVVISKPFDNVSLCVYSNIGVLVFQATNALEISAIDLSNCAEGLYIVKVVKDNNIIGSQILIRQ